MIRLTLAHFYRKRIYKRSSGRAGFMVVLADGCSF